MERPLIFISNDDGFMAGGLEQLVGMVRQYGDVFVVAPDSGRSGAGMSISAAVPVRNRLIREEEVKDGMGRLTVWSCSGTPIDCVKMAFEKLLPRKADVVLGGINYGTNSSVNAHYSGTVSIVMEGLLKGIPSVAFSSGYTNHDADFSAMRPIVQSLVEMALRGELPKGCCLNVNAPAVEVFKGVKICRMGMGEWREEFEERLHPHGGKYYWIAGYYDPSDGDDQETDTWAFDNGYIAITPLKLDLTDYEAKAKLEELMAPSQPLPYRARSNYMGDWNH